MADKIVITPSDDVKKVLADAGVKSVVDSIAKAEDDVKDVIVSAAVVEVDGRTFGCGCGGWAIALHISRSPKSPALPIQAVAENTADKSNAHNAPHKE